MSVLQKKLAVGPSDDPLEREADRVADRVMRMEDAAPDIGAGAARLARKCACDDEESGTLQPKPAGAPVAVGGETATSGAAPPGVARVAAGDEAPRIVHEALDAPAQPLDVATRAFFEPRFGHDFGRVRVHHDGRAGASTQAVNALAYTVGHDIVFREGRFAPHTPAGRQLLAHELAHVVQQERGGGGILSRYEPSPGYAAPPIETEPEPELTPGIGEAPAPVPSPQARRDQAYRESSDFGALYERAKHAPDCDGAKEELETPLATLDRGGARPDFVTVGKAKKDTVQVGSTFCTVTFEPHAFHILDAIEYRVGQVQTNDGLKQILKRYVDADQVTLGTQDFVIPPLLDPGAVARVAAYTVAVKRRAATDPRFDPAKDPSLAVPEDLPADAVQRGCRISAGRGFLDPRFETPPFDNWSAATYCQTATGSLFEYRVTAPNGRDYALYDGKKGSVVYECKCGYEAIPTDIQSDNPKKRARAESRLLQILRQKENHASVARQCDLSLTYKVSSPGLTQILRAAWSDVSVDNAHILGYAESCGP